MEDQTIVVLAAMVILGLVQIVAMRGFSLTVVEAIKADPALLDKIENLVLKTVPVNALVMVNKGAQAVMEIADVVETVTDSEPNS